MPKIQLSAENVKWVSIPKGIADGFGWKKGDNLEWLIISKTSCIVRRVDARDAEMTSQAILALTNKEMRGNAD
jgi:bifunctional DNA-binding transcriptional regulator/antitoxin component of YhaV-PrlF toxin-antitoxin module